MACCPGMEVVKRKVRSMCIATREIMDCMFDVYKTDDGIDSDDFPPTKDPVYILGEKYNSKKDLAVIRQDILSRIWCTYRKGFVPIGGGNGLTTDRGWGCMLRCGQMVLAQALVLTHLGREWVWDPECRDPIYLKIVKKFEDNRQAPFSIHQIALMGASEGKEVGEWFGPNTVAQVLRKLVKYDEWSSVVIHVALDNLVIISEIRDLCFGIDSENDNKDATEWKPLILIVPLRLGLTDINPIYVSGLQTCFKFKQSLGVIGGKPNLALYFIGCVGEQVICLDPHTTQRTGSVDNKQTEDQIEMDTTYHCNRASRMSISVMDPSLAVCFFCKTEVDFNDLCYNIQERLVKPEKQPLFEICINPPKVYTPSIELEEMATGYTPRKINKDDRHKTGKSYDSDESEFEML